MELAIPAFRMLPVSFVWPLAALALNAVNRMRPAAILCLTVLVGLLLSLVLSRCFALRQHVLQRSVACSTLIATVTWFARPSIN